MLPTVNSSYWEDASLKTFMSKHTHALGRQPLSFVHQKASSVEAFTLPPDSSLTNIEIMNEVPEQETKMVTKETNAVFHSLRNYSVRS